MPQGIDEDYNGVMDAEEVPQDGGPDPVKLRMLLMKLVEMLGLGDASDPSQGAEPHPGLAGALQETFAAPAPPGEDQTAIENDMRGGKSFDEFHGTDLEGSGSFQPPADKAKQLGAFRAKLKAPPK